MHTFKFNRVLVLGVVLGVVAGAQAQSFDSAAASQSKAYAVSSNLNKAGINDLAVSGTVQGSSSSFSVTATSQSSSQNGNVTGGHGRTVAPEPVSMTLMAAAAVSGFLRIRRRK